MARWTLTIRNGPHVERVAFDTLDAALAAVQRRLDELGPQARREDFTFLRRTIDASRQVAIRAELTGPDGARGGVDLRGDGSAEAFTGRWRRAVVEQRKRETAVDALRRALAD
jgi:hypothetical protein